MHARSIAQAALGAFAAASLVAGIPPDLSPAINRLGLDLYRRQITTSPGQPVLLSPYSIAAALAMTYVGAAGETKSEMTRVLCFPEDPADCAAGFKRMARQLHEPTAPSDEAAVASRHAYKVSPLTLTVANRIYVQHGFDLRSSFTRILAEEFDAPIGDVDFQSDPAGARQVINQWVNQVTQGRIAELLPVGQPPADTRLALINAVYLKAAWRDPFGKYRTQTEPFHLKRKQTVKVPTMYRQGRLGYARRDRYSVVTVPYEGGVQFVLFLPDEIDPVPACFSAG